MAGTWCPQCAVQNKVIYTTNELHEFATAKQGQFLDDEYLGLEIKHLWQCSEGHKWMATWKNILRGSWCHICQSKIDNIESLRTYAFSKGGKCLSVEYINKRTKYLWQCTEGHEWQAAWGNVKSHQSWCPRCNHRRH